LRSELLFPIEFTPVLEFTLWTGTPGTLFEVDIDRFQLFHVPTQVLYKSLDLLEVLDFLAQ
jgi:hypothetical protein